MSRGVSKKQASKVDSGASKTNSGSEQNGGPVNAKVTAVSSASLDNNAKEFIPKTSMVQRKVHPHPHFEPYPSGFNPIAGVGALLHHARLH